MIDFAKPPEPVYPKEATPTSRLKPVFEQLEENGVEKIFSGYLPPAKIEFLQGKIILRKDITKSGKTWKFKEISAPIEEISLSDVVKIIAEILQRGDMNGTN